MAGYGGGFVQSSMFRPSGEKTDPGLRTKVRELERKVDRLELVSRMLWEFVRDGAKLTEDQMEAKVRAIDKRDGVEDGRVTTVPLRCPTCKRVASSKHWKCLYCGQEFEKFAY